MLTLYVKAGCPFCAKVLDTVAELGVPLEEKDVADEEAAKELVARGGKLQTPYLADSERGVEMYESADINEYLRANYGKQNHDV